MIKDLGHFLLCMLPIFACVVFIFLLLDMVGIELSGSVSFALGLFVGFLLFPFTDDFFSRRGL